MKCIDGFVIPLSKKKVAAYKRLSAKAGKVWMEHGALSYVECVGDDLNAEHGLPFPKLANLKKGETVAFSWIVYKSRAHRDRVLKKVMADPRIAEDMKDMKKMPFDLKRMTYGTFTPLVDL